MDLEQKAKKLIKEYGMICGGDKILVAFSGGSDSSALLFFLLGYAGEANKFEIYAAHLNHRIRGADADSDEKSAAETCGRYNVKIFAERRDIPEIAKKAKKSLEEAARAERYDFLKKTAEKIGGAVKIATAHTASDNTESVIFNLARGCGIDGLRGVAPVNGNIIRPLLSCSSEDVAEYCEKNSINYVTDKTNSDETYTRNFIRHNVASKLKEKFENLDENIFKTSEIMRAAADFLDYCADGLTGRADSGAPLAYLAAQHEFIKRALIAKLYGNAVFPDVRKLEYRHILYVEDLMDNPQNHGKSIDLPGFVTARVSGGNLVFEKSNNKMTSGKNRR